MAKLEASIEKIENILKINLSIPFFQRPYCWSKSNVCLLLEDVYRSLKNGKQSYRIGSIILYKPEKDDCKLQIVDGQQRITTILLILKVLNNDFVGKNLYNTILDDFVGKNVSAKHKESDLNICQNNKFIEEWMLRKKINEEDEFYKYLIEHCEFVKIVVRDLSEAFQMFDSQNGRGKELEAYNLLKAYHIRAMETESQEIKIKCDKRWENSTKYKNDPNDKKEQTQDILKQVIEQLYRIRKWSRKETMYDSYNFNKCHIAEFKGITIDRQHIINFPFQNSYLLQYITREYLESFNLCVSGIKPRFLAGDSENINPFVLINQNIINGKHFFDYIESYVEIYKQLFVKFKISWLEEKIHHYCPRSGIGNEAMFELFKSLLLVLFDKYGEDEMKNYWQDLYVIIYSLRLKTERNVLRKRIIEHPKELFTLIESTNNNYDLSCISDRAKKEIEDINSDFKYTKWRQDVEIKNFYKDHKKEDPMTKIIIQKFKEKYKEEF